MAKIPEIKMASQHMPMFIESTTAIGELKFSEPVKVVVREQIKYIEENGGTHREFAVDLWIKGDNGNYVIASILHNELERVIATLGGIGGATIAKASFPRRRAFFDATPSLRFVMPDTFGDKIAFGVEIYRSDSRDETMRIASSYGSIDPLLLETVKILRKAQETIKAAEA